MKGMLAMVVAGLMLAPHGAWAQEKTPAAGTSAKAEDEAANLMVRRIYIHEPATIVLPSAVMARLRTLGYRDLRDFDIERGVYEIEATSPSGQAVELEVDPVSGAIVDIDENWF